jgi:hypothetical protein
MTCLDLDNSFNGEEKSLSFLSLNNAFLEKELLSEFSKTKRARFFRTTPVYISNQVAILITLRFSLQ